MALIDCSDCDKKISDKASACPNCGAPNQSFVRTTNSSALRNLAADEGMSILHPKASKPVFVLACCLLAAFFMPWFQLFGFAASGYNLGQLGSYGNFAWMIPILAGATIVASLTGCPNRGIGAVTGIFPLLAILYGLFRLTSAGGSGTINTSSQIIGQVLSFGAYVTLSCSVAIIFAAVPPGVVKTLLESD